MANINKPLPQDSNNVVFAGYYDTAGHQFVAPQAGTVVNDSGNLSAPAMVQLIDGGDVTQGTISDTAWTGTGTATLIAIQKMLATMVQGGTGKISVQGTPDGSTATLLKTLVDGTIVTNSSLTAGSSVIGTASTYREAVARRLIGNQKTLYGTLTLTNGTQSITSWTDQAGNAYTTVTNGKTLYISGIDATVDLSATSQIQSYGCSITDGTNTQYTFTASSVAAPRILASMISVASGKTLTASITAGNLGGSSAGTVRILMNAWEE